jgi:hypothetical protein
MVIMAGIRRLLVVVAVLFLSAVGLFAQDSPSTRPTESTPVKLNLSGSAKIEAQPHRFWDKENAELFAGVCGARMLDYASSRHMRHQGRNELLLSNWVVDNRQLFVGIELAGTAASIGMSYLFHRMHHHTLERWVSISHIGVGAGGSIYNYALQPARGAIGQPVTATK